MPISSRLLDDDEELLVDLRPHWVFMLGPAVLTAVAVAVAVTVVVRFPKAPVSVAGVLAVMVAVPVIWLTARLVRWLGISLVVTTSRMIYRRGVFGRDLVQLRLQRIAEVHCSQTLMDRLIGSGRLVVEIVGDSPLAIEDVRRPRTLQRVITRQLDEVTLDRSYGAGDWSRVGGRSPAADVPSHPVSVPRPFTMGDTPPHGTPPLGNPRHVVPPTSVLPPVPFLNASYPTVAGSYESTMSHPPVKVPHPDSHLPPAPLPMDRPPTMGTSIPEQLIQLDDLRRRGIISEGEFEAKKAELLSRL